LTEAGGGDAAERVRPYIDHLLETFGPARLLFGSDWPVLTLAATYADWLALAGACTMHLSPDERAAIFGGNAARVYLHRRGRR
jgi:L-fuconolactonase